MEKFFRLIGNIIFWVIKAAIILIICIYVLFSWLGFNPLVVFLIYGFILSFMFWRKTEHHKRFIEKGERIRLEKKLAEQALIKEQERIEREDDELKRIQELERAERERIKLECAEQERIKLEKERIEHRDADSQDKPYEYECKGHPNVTLAIRYGIANLKKEVKEYWYHGRGGEKMRNPDRDTISIVPADTIRLQKIEKIKSDSEASHYLARLTDFGNRKVIVCIQNHSETVKTFYPNPDYPDWGERYADLESALKDNPTFSLKELANFHIQKVVINS